MPSQPDDLADFLLGAERDRLSDPANIFWQSAERGLRNELLRLQIRKTRQDMILDQWRFILLTLGALVAVGTLAFTAGTFFRHQPTSPTFIVLGGEHSSS